MCVYCYHVTLTFCYKVRKIQEKNIVNSVIVQVFDRLSRQSSVLFMYKWVWLCASIINTKPISWVYSFSLKYFYKNKDK